MSVEGPAALPWAEKVRRMVAVMVDHGLPEEGADRFAEDLLVAIGDANE